MFMSHIMHTVLLNCTFLVQSQNKMWTTQTWQIQYFHQCFTIWPICDQRWHNQSEKRMWISTEQSMYSMINIARQRTIMDSALCIKTTVLHSEGHAYCTVWVVVWWKDVKFAQYKACENYSLIIHPYMCEYIYLHVNRLDRFSKSQVNATHTTNT